MKAVLKYSKSEIDKAGIVLSGGLSPKMKLEQAIEILENFRSVHIHPLIVFRMSLIRKSRDISENFLVSQRMKRAPSIVNKLKIQKNMSLSRMQDIGGLRVVFDTLDDVYELRKRIRAGENQLAFKSIFIKERDYIENPKESGYRSLHLIYKYGKKLEPSLQCNIEIQIRTKIQHAWATAVEVIGTYLRQPLKQSFGDAELLELFKEISKAFILIENDAIDIQLFKRTSDKITELKLREKLKGFTLVTKISTEGEEKEKGKYYLITLNLNERILSLKRYSETKLEEANNEYSELEKRYLNEPSTEVVLVSVDDINNLKKLYPNYFLDTEEFVKLLDTLEEKIKNYEN